MLALQRAAGNRATARAVALMRTPKEISADRQDLPHSWTARFSAELDTTELTLTIRARIEPDRDVTEAQEEAVKKQADRGVQAHLGLQVRRQRGRGQDRAPGAGQCGVRRTRSRTWSIQLRQGAKEDNRRIWFVGLACDHPARTSSGTSSGSRTRRSTRAFENRKTAKSPGVFQDNSIMGDYPKEGPAKATAKLRHGESILKEVGKAFGKTFTVRMNVPRSRSSSGAATKA